MSEETEPPPSVVSDLPPFAMIPRWLVEDSEITAIAVRVFGALTRYAGLPNGAVPSRARIARTLGVSASTVKRALRDLEAAGALTVESRRTERGDPDTNRYVLHYRRTEEGSPVTGGVGSPVTRPQGSPMTPERDQPGRETEEENPSTSGASGSDDDGPTYPEEVYGLTREFATLVKRNGHTLPTKGSKAAAGWLREMDRLRRIGPPGDGQDPPGDDEIRSVMRWALTVSSFWPANIRSVPKFREQFTTLRGQRDRDQRPGKAPPGPALAEGYSAAAEEFRRRRGETR